MFKIYRRYNPSEPPKPVQSNRNNIQGNHRGANESKTRVQETSQRKESASAEKNLLLDFLPSNLYNPNTKKILGFFSAEDLLLVALIFLFLEDNKEDNPLLALALVYVLLSDYINIDIPGFQ